MSERQDNPPSHPRRRAVVPPFLPPRGAGLDRPARPSVQPRKTSTPPFAPQARQVAAPAVSRTRQESAPEELALSAVDAPEDVAHIVPEAHDTAVAHHGEPLELTDWLEDDDFSPSVDSAQGDAAVESMQAGGETAEASDSATAWPAETWHPDPWSETANRDADVMPTSEHAVDSAAPVTPFEFAAEFPEPEAFTSSVLPPAAADEQAPVELPVESYGQDVPVAQSVGGANAGAAPWVPPTVEPIAESSELLARYATRPEAGEAHALERVKEIEPWAMPSPAPSSSSAEDAIAAALERIARRIRDGEVVLPPESTSATDEAALALTLAALLRTPPKG